jgi:hypothetical protein
MRHAVSRAAFAIQPQEDDELAIEIDSALAP